MLTTETVFETVVVVSSQTRTAGALTSGVADSYGDAVAPSSLYGGEQLQPWNRDRKAANVLGRLYGAGERNRTSDLLITNQLLYRLSYSGGEMRGAMIADGRAVCCPFL